MIAARTFEPDWASPPGLTICHLMRNKGLSVVDLAHHTGRSVEYIANLLSGSVEVNADLASALASLLGASSAFWQKRELHYTAQLSKAAERAAPDEIAAWIAKLPVKSMQNLGWLQPTGRSDSQKAASCFRFFGVTEVTEWSEKYSSVTNTVAFKHTEFYESQPFALAAWLRQAEIQANAISCEVWNKGVLLESLHEIRSLTRLKSPALFLNKLKAYCALSGVALVIVETPSACHATAATKFVSKQKAMIVLSGRYRTDDHFWFAFFHEVGHLILHDNSRLFVEQPDLDQTNIENEANTFSADWLIPKEYRPELAKIRLSAEGVIKFARRIGVSPGIVVGQLQHSGRLRYTHLNSLKRRFSFDG